MSVGAIVLLALLGLGLIVGLLFDRWLKNDGAFFPRRREPEPARPRAAAADRPPLGKLASIHAMLEPSFVRPGHGVLVLLDLDVDGLSVDGFEAGDPCATPHADFKGSFRGYFNVPPGRHELVARRQQRRSVLVVEVAINGVCVARLDWASGDWVALAPAAAEPYARLARTGSLRLAGALRPWPLAALFFDDAPPDLEIDGRALAATGGFIGLVNIPPGQRQIRTGTWCETVVLPAAAQQLLVFGTVPPTFVPAELAQSMVSSRLLTVPENALISWSARAGSMRTFGPEGLARLATGYSSYRSTGDPAAYVEVVRQHRVAEHILAPHAAHFGDFTAAVIGHLREAPELSRVPALRTYLGYIAEDLQDTQVAGLFALGQELERRLGDRPDATMESP